MLNLSPLDFFNIKINIPRNENEQIKISKFLDLINKKINVISSKLNTLKKYKEGLTKTALSYAFTNGKKINFNYIFEQINESNSNGKYDQFTVGKYGLKSITDINYDISNHKLFYPGNLIMGIGIDEIGYSTSTTGSVSPVYEVYKIVDENFSFSISRTIKGQLWNIRNQITRKSTRREFEFDKKELKKSKIYVVDNNSFSSFENAFNYLDIKLRTLGDKLIKLNYLKAKILKEMFI